MNQSRISPAPTNSYWHNNLNTRIWKKQEKTDWSVYFCKKLMLMLVNKDCVNRVPKATDFPFSFRASIKKRVIKMAVKSEVPIPINKVVANPLMGPVPNTKRINAVSPVVILASKIEDNALLNPSATDFLSPLPFLSSSLTLSKINPNRPILQRILS